MFVRDRWQDRSGIRGLADQVGVSHATLYSWFNGASAPDTSQLASLADALGTSPTELVAAMSGSDAPRTIDERFAPAVQDVAAMVRPDWARPKALKHSLMPEAFMLADLAERGLPHPSPRLVDLLPHRAVETCQVEEPIGPVARRMYEWNFSQLPVYNGDRLVGLLTTDTIARWHAAFGVDAPEEAPVGAVTEHAEEPRNFRVVSPNATAADAVRLFEAAMLSGHPLSAVLVTTTGGPAGTPLAILTSADLPEVHNA